MLLADGSEFDISAVLRLDGSRYAVESLTFSRVDGGPSITGEHVRRVPIAGLVSAAVASEVRVEDEGGRLIRPSLTGERRAALRAAGPTDETLREVATAYMFAQLSGEPTAKSVSVVLGIPIATANNWIRRAKDRGHLVEG